jgi:hypothetical protein
MKKIKKLETPKIIYFILVGIVVLEIIGAIFTVIFAATPTQRDAGISNIFLGFLAVTLFSIPWLIESRFKLDIPNYLEVIVLIFLFCSIVLGSMHNLLATVKGYDKVLHIASGIFISVTGFEIIHFFNISKTKESRLKPGILSIFAFCFSVTLLVLWEFYEFAVDTIAYNVSSISERNMQRYQWINESTIYPQSYGLMDTMLDLLIGSFGAMVVAIVGWRMLVYKQRKELNSND